MVGAMMAPIMRLMMARHIKRMLVMLDKTDDIEYSCEEAYAVLEIYAEFTSRGEDPSRLMPLVKRHLELCSNCREEFESLLAAMAVVEG